MRKADVTDEAIGVAPARAGGVSVVGRPPREPAPTAEYAVRSVSRVLDILELLREASDGLSLATIVEETRVPRSSAFRYLAVLEQRGFVTRTQTGLYMLWLALLPPVSRRLELLTAKARPLLESLRDQFGESINLGVLSGTRIAYLAIVESPHAMRMAARPGDLDLIHSTALGKAVAAELTVDEVDRIIAVNGLPQRTTRTITTFPEFIKELERVKERGFAVDDEENEEGARCIAVCIPTSSVHAALSLSAPALRFPRDKSALVTALSGAAESLATWLRCVH